VLSALLLAGLAAAQKMTVTGGVLQPGQLVDVSYTDPSRAGQVVTVQVDNGNPDQPTVVSLPVQLDGQGHGLAHWMVMNWWSAAFNAPGVEQVTRCIYGPDDQT
jgi:hypothetical protein